MTWNRLKKGIAGTALVLTFLLGSGAMLATTVQAQDRNRDRNWQRDRDEHRDRDRDWERRRQTERSRDWERQRERERLRNRPVYVYPTPRVYSSPRVYPYPNGGYGRNGGYYNGGYSSYDEQKGFRDGLDRGQEDVRDRRSPNPNNSQHFREGNAAYRAGFRRGYEQGYRQYGGGYRRW